MHTVEQLQALASSLEDEFYEVEVSEHNGRKHVLVTHDNEHAMRITPDYSHDGIKEYLLRYDCTLIPPHGERVEAEYDDMDEVRAALEKQQDIDPDAAVAAFVQQVNELFSNDVWRLGDSWLSDMIAHWGPVDWDEDRYRGKVDAMGVQQVHLGAFGEVEAVEMLAMGDFYGEETATLSGNDLVGQTAAWLTEEVDSCGLDAHGR